MIGSPLHQSPSWGPPYVLQQMQQRGGKDHNKQPPSVPTQPSSDVPDGWKKDTSIHHLWQAPAPPPRDPSRPALHDAGLD